MSTACVSDEMMRIRAAADLNNVQVEETLAYYSMLHRKPWGKHHVQICTTWRAAEGGNELLDRARSGWRSAQGNDSRRRFLAEEVECIGPARARRRCSHYDFTKPYALKFVASSGSDAGNTPYAGASDSGALHERHPSETPLISRRWGIKDSHKIDVYLMQGAIRHWKKC